MYVCVRETECVRHKEVTLAKVFDLPDVHESQSSDVWRVHMIKHGIDLLPGQLESEKLEEKTVGCRHYTTCCNTTNLERERDREREREKEKEREREREREERKEGKRNKQAHTINS